MERKIDAAAAAAASYFASLAAAAGEDGLNTRERGAYLFQLPDGSVVLGPISTGPLFENGGTGTTGELSFGGYDPAYLVGSIHNHSVGNHLPSTGPSPQSDGDRGHYDFMRRKVQVARGNPENVRIYITAQILVGAEQQPYNMITVFDNSNINIDIANGRPSAEVDPNGQSCPE